MNFIRRKRNGLRGVFTLVAFILTVTPSVNSQGTANGSAEWLMYVGTYTNNPQQPSKGIYAYRYQASGKFTSLGAVATTSNPTFLAVGQGGRFLYAANE